MHKIFILHFQPLEKYPPVMNLVRFLSKENQGDSSIQVVTTSVSNRPQFFVKGVTIHRPAGWSQPMNSIKRAWLYLVFNLGALWLLIKNKPSRVLYYETMSALPAAWYKKFFSRSAEIFVHYHEYTSPREYQCGSALNRWFHRIELSIMNSIRWVSHTNGDRLKMFLKDINGRVPEQTGVLENLPPSSWRTAIREHTRRAQIKFVYVGAFSLETLYVKEWASFIKAHPEKYSWDIYSDNFDPTAKQWIIDLQAPNIQFKGAVQYDDLPKTLQVYDAGLILYKGHIPNYIYNAPNKLFEYLACGLDVLFPKSMTGCFPYVTEDAYPKIVAIDFKALSVSLIDNAVDRSGLQRRPSSYHYESNLSPLTKLLLNA